MIDRPQMFSNVCPVLYGLVPRTLCGDKVAKFAMDETGRTGIEGDMDPIDICVFTEKPVNHGSILVKARLIGGFRMLDGEEADDKIVAVLDQDLTYGKINDISELPPKIVDRLRHYFLTYKQIPGDDEKHICEITDIYGVEDAKKVLNLSMEDYNDKYANQDITQSLILSLESVPGSFYFHIKKISILVSWNSRNKCEQKQNGERGESSPILCLAREIFLTAVPVGVQVVIENVEMNSKKF